jgi:branched-chain amino acid aminotransferase
MQHQFFFQNGQLTPSSGLMTENIPSGKSIYEVIRLIDGIPLFVEDHLARLEDSSKMIFGENTVDRREIIRNILELSKKNAVIEGNVKIIICKQAPAGSDTLRLIFFIPHHYPTPEAYAQGYALKSLILERPVPNAKVINKNLTQTAEKLKAANPSIDEILLLRHDGIITEGSKSNIFFVSGTKLITPAKNLVLEGITRQKIIAVCEANTIECEESRSLKLTDLVKMDGAFITGTSPKVMPVKRIDNVTLDAENQLIRDISIRYDTMIRQYLKHFRRH